ncbi:MAG: PQQ-dependent sugar dehydrogenase [Novosphingobium sp.]|nr:PQQ-dependent sugar dehydrogenase [Novosphingobium sp.]
MENEAGTVYTATASDSDGDTVTFAIAGGADSARLQITPDGNLSFRSPPDFEVPADADGNNIYDVILSVSDGTASAELAVAVTVTDVTSGNFKVRRVGSGFDRPLFLTAMPDGSGRVLIVEHTGLIHLFDPQTGTRAATPFLDATALIASGGERGLKAIALAPDYMTSGQAYVVLTAPDGSIELYRLLASTPERDVLGTANRQLLLSIPHPGAIHYGGWLGFGRDGLLYVSVGDGEDNAGPFVNSQDTSVLLGSVLRIDVTRDDFPGDPDRNYGIPASNPFANAEGAGEIWLYGLRNPFRCSFDRATGELWIGDVGLGTIEEIDRVTTDETQFNLGWPLFEGTRPLLGEDPAGLTMPVVQYNHGTGPLEGNSVTGGFVYRGPIESLQAQYIFADFVNGNVWTVPIASVPRGATAMTSVLVNRKAEFTPDTGRLIQISSFGEDEAGNLYIVSLAGDIFRIEAAP